MKQTKILGLKVPGEISLGLKALTLSVRHTTGKRITGSALTRAAVSAMLNAGLPPSQMGTEDDARELIQSRLVGARETVDIAVPPSSRLLDKKPEKTVRIKNLKPHVPFQAWGYLREMEGTSDSVDVDGFPVWVPGGDIVMVESVTSTYRSPSIMGMPKRGMNKLQHGFRYWYANPHDPYWPPASGSVEAASIEAGKDSLRMEDLPEKGKCIVEEALAFRAKTKGNDN